MSLLQLIESLIFQNAALDFIKIHTDGDDYFVLKRAEKTLKDRGVLGVMVECLFHGTVADDAPLFRNIDGLLHRAG